jgi:hypothetical protein
LRRSGIGMRDVVPSMGVVLSTRWNPSFLNGVGELGPLLVRF